jgi:hypothetical protein
MDRTWTEWARHTASTVGDEIGQIAKNPWLDGAVVVGMVALGACANRYKISAAVKELFPRAASLLDTTASTEFRTKIAGAINKSGSEIPGPLEHAIPNSTAGILAKEGQSASVVSLTKGGGDGVMETANRSASSGIAVGDIDLRVQGQHLFMNNAPSERLAQKIPVTFEHPAEDLSGDMVQKEGYVRVTAEQFRPGMFRFNVVDHNLFSGNQNADSLAFASWGSDAKNMDGVGALTHQKSNF